MLSITTCVTPSRRQPVSQSKTLFGCRAEAASKPQRSTPAEALSPGGTKTSAPPVNSGVLAVELQARLANTLGAMLNWSLRRAEAPT